MVETAEYRGRDFYGTARTSDNVELFFRSDRKVASGETVRLGADPARVLVYARGERMTSQSILVAAAAAMSGCRCACASPSAASTA